MYIYIAVFLISLLFIWLGTKAKNKFTYYALIGIGLTIPCLLAAFRDYSIGTDVMVYQKPWFDLAKKLGLFAYIDKSQGMEIFYCLITWFSAHLFNKSISLLFFIIQALIIVPVFISLNKLKKNNADVMMGMFIYYMFWYNATYNLARQSIAMAFVILALTYFEKNNYKRTVLFTIIAFLFHSSALISIPIYVFLLVVNSKYLSKLRKFIITLFLIIFSFVIFTKFSDILLHMSESSNNILKKYGSYINIFASNKKFSIGFNVIFWIIIIVSSYNYRKKIELSTPKINGLYYLLPFIILGIYLDSKVTYIIRVFYYLEMPYLILIYSRIPKLLNDKANVKILTTMYIVLFVVFWFYVYVYSGGSETVPYLFRK